jgi:predicted dinucleotide-binding enzyme
MNITIIGASHTFARGIATWAVTAGHNVTIVGSTRARAAAFVEEIGSASPAGPAEALHDNVIFVAMPYVCVIDARESYGAQLDGSIIVDVTTPVDFNLEPVRPEAGSTAQALAKARPRARVVKAFNPNFAGTFVGAQSAASEKGEVFLAGDDSAAKHVVAQLFEKSGLRAIDVGGLHRAGELEAFGFRYMAARQTLETRPAALP